jgi:hypothetical protein
LTRASPYSGHLIAGALTLAIGASAAATTARADEAQQPVVASEPAPRLFSPLLADSSEPHFSATALRTQLETDGHFVDVASVGLGDEFIVWSRRGGRNEWQVGLQAGMTGQFRLARESSYTLLNTDYLVGVPLAWRRGRTSARLRLYHRSSHAGDEYLIQNPSVRPLNFSFEELEALASHDLAGGRGRAYAGGGYLIHRRPSMARGKLVAGVEWKARDSPGCSTPRGLAGRLIAGLEVKLLEEHAWRPHLLTSFGVELAGRRGAHALDLLAEYYHGSSPYGQFYRQQVDHVGLGLHLDL